MSTQGQAISLDITREQLAKLPTGAREVVQALLNTRQALYDVLGAYPADNVLPYFYQFSNTAVKGNAIPANGQVQNSIKISADAAFIAMSARGSSDGDFLMFMRTDSSDRQLMNEAVHSTAIMGTAERPGVFNKPLLLAPNTTLSFDLTDLSGSTNQVYFALAGFKFYNRRISG